MPGRRSQVGILRSCAPHPRARTPPPLSAARSAPRSPNYPSIPHIGGAATTRSAAVSGGVQVAARLHSVRTPSNSTTCIHGRALRTVDTCCHRSLSSTRHRRTASTPVISSRHHIHPLSSRHGHSYQRISDAIVLLSEPLDDAFFSRQRSRRRPSRHQSGWLRHPVLAASPPPLPPG